MRSRPDRPPGRHPLTRRNVLALGAGGVALGLPWLEVMAPRLNAATAKPRLPVRMAVLYMPNGVHPDMWTPEGEGRDFKLSPTLQPLEDLKSEIVVPTNLWNQATKGGEGHYVKVSGFLTCTTITKTQGVDLNCNGVSMDQVAAKALGSQTPLPSLELGISPVSTGVDVNVGYTRVHGAHVAWSGPTTNGSAAYFRIQGPTLVIEYAPQDSVEHIHTIYRDPTNDYGAKFSRK